jgi:hypothetical protein
VEKVNCHETDLHAINLKKRPIRFCKLVGLINGGSYTKASVLAELSNEPRHFPMIAGLINLAALLFSKTYTCKGVLPGRKAFSAVRRPRFFPWLRSRSVLQSGLTNKVRFFYG